jgi:hypothetical protein
MNLKLLLAMRKKGLERQKAVALKMQKFAIKKIGKWK